MAVPRVVKTVVRRPVANKGGRREEERCPGISIRQADGPHNRKVVISFSPESAPNRNIRDKRCAKVPQPCGRGFVKVVCPAEGMLAVAGEKNICPSLD